MNIKQDFEFLKNHTYLDTAAGSLKPQVVIDAVSSFYLKTPVNPHSPDSKVGVKVQSVIKETRKMAASLINASEKEVIFTSGTTDSLNKASQMLKMHLKPDDEILLSYLNHSSNHIPWVEIAKEKGAKIIFSTDFKKDINPKTKIIAFAQQNNTLEQMSNLPKIYELAQKNNAFVINDAAQAIIHEPVSLKYSDMITFSANKLYGPTGIGILAIKEKILKTLRPSTFGGGATREADLKTWIPANGVLAFESGTPNTAGIFGFLAAMKYYKNLVKNKVWDHEQEVAKYAFDQLSKQSNIRLFSEKGHVNILFNIEDKNAQDVVSYLGHNNILLRAGTHCVKLLPTVLETASVIRVSLGAYNTKKDIDHLIDKLKQGGDFLEFI